MTDGGRVLILAGARPVGRALHDPWHKHGNDPTQLGIDGAASGAIFEYLVSRLNNGEIFYYPFAQYASLSDVPPLPVPYYVGEVYNFEQRPNTFGKMDWDEWHSFLEAH